MSLLTRHGFIVSEDDFEPWYREELTVEAEKSFMFKKKPQPFPVFEYKHDGTVAVPRYWGEHNFGRPKKLFGYVQKSKNMVFKGELRSFVQKDAAKKSVEQLSSKGGGVLSLFTGCGKTIISLHVACSMGLKTLVVVHKQFLLDQWEERIKTFVPKAKIGRLQRDVEDVNNCDIVVGMLQSIAMREYDDHIYSDFGLIIFDEVHVVPAPVFSRALLRLCAPYMFGLSATPVRKDGLSKVIHWFIGPIFFEHSLSGKTEVTVRTVKFRLNRQLPQNMAVATTILCGMPDRNALIVSEIIKLVSANHKVILLSDRRTHCEHIMFELKKQNIQGALYLGGMSSYELAQSTKRKVLLATYSMAKEGLDIPSLNALVLACPRSDVVQACGRILHGKTELSPVIVDIVDQWFIGEAQFRKRTIYYNKAGFNQSCKLFV